MLNVCGIWIDYCNGMHRIVKYAKQISIDSFVYSTYSYSIQFTVYSTLGEIIRRFTDQ